MRILIKAFRDIYISLQKNYKFCHCAYYYPFLFKEIFRQLGCESEFFGEAELKPHIINTYRDDDILFFWGLESYVFDKDYCNTLLQNFKGKKILYITAQIEDEIINHFDYIFPTESYGYENFYKEHYPNAKVRVVPFSAPLYSFVDEINQNPVADDEKFKIIYTGIITERYLRFLNDLAWKGENIYLGGIYIDNPKKGCRHFTIDETKEIINPKIKLITPTANFEYGYHFHFLKHCDLGINFYPSNRTKSKPINSKIIDYLICGIPVISENENPGNYRLEELNAGRVCKWNNFEDMYYKIQDEKNTKRDRELIMKKARETFHPLRAGKIILEEIR